MHGIAGVSAIHLAAFHYTDVRARRRQSSGVKECTRHPCTSSSGCAAPQFDESLHRSTAFVDCKAALDSVDRQALWKEGHSCQGNSIVTRSPQTSMRQQRLESGLGSRCLLSALRLQASWLSWNFVHHRVALCPLSRSWSWCGKHEVQRSWLYAYDAVLFIAILTSGTTTFSLLTCCRYRPTEAMIEWWSCRIWEQAKEALKMQDLEMQNRIKDHTHLHSNSKPAKIHGRITNEWTSIQQDLRCNCTGNDCR